MRYLDIMILYKANYNVNTYYGRRYYILSTQLVTTVITTLITN